MKKMVFLVLATLVLTAFGCATVEPVKGNAPVSVEERQGARWIGTFELIACKTEDLPCTPENALWTDTIHNALNDDGEQHMLDVYFRNATGVTSFYLALSDSSSPCSIQETDNLATALTGEPTSNGYARQQIERSNTGWPTLALDSGDYQVTSSTETFSASGGSWGPVCCAVLTNVQTGTSGLNIAHAALSTCRTLADGESLQVTYKVKQQ